MMASQSRRRGAVILPLTYGVRCRAEGLSLMPLFRIQASIGRPPLHSLATAGPVTTFKDLVSHGTMLALKPPHGPDPALAERRRVATQSAGEQDLRSAKMLWFARPWSDAGG